MLSMFKMLNRNVLPQWSLFILISVAAVQGSKIMFGGEEPVIAICTFVVIAGLVMGGSHSDLISKNLAWIMALPLSKRRIMAFKYLWSMYAFFLAAVAVASALAIIVHLNNYTARALELLAHYFNNSNATQARSYESMLNEAKYAVIFASGLHCAFLALRTAQPGGSPLIAHWDRLSKKQKQKFTAAFLVMGGLAVAFGPVIRSYFTAGFGQMTLWCALLVMLAAISATSALKMPKRHSRLIWGVSAAVVALQVGFVYKLALSGVSSSESKDRIASLSFLGGFGPGLTKRDIAKLLESGTGGGQLRSLREAHSFLNNVDPLADGDLDFFRLIEAQKSRDAVWDIVSIFKPDALTAKHLQAIFQKLSALPPSDRNDSLRLLSAQVSAGDLAAMLRSQSQDAAQYATVRARYERYPELAAVFHEQLLTAGDKLKLSMLATLSYYYGRKLGLNDWIELKSGRSIASSLDYFIPNCAHANVADFKAVTTEQLSLLNVCLRQKLNRQDRYWVERAETLGWLELPLGPRDIALLRHVFKPKNANRQ